MVEVGKKKRAFKLVGNKERAHMEVAGLSIEDIIFRWMAFMNT